MWWWWWCLWAGLAALLAYGLRANRVQTSQFRAARTSAMRRLAADSGGKKVAFVTGANSGVGLQLAQDLAACGVHVVLGCRSQERAERAATSIRAVAKPGVDVSIVQVDLSSPASARQAAQTYMRQYGRLDFLACNAGLLPVTHKRTSVVVRALCTLRLGMFLSTSRAYFGGPSFLVNPPNDTTPTGLGRLLAVHVLGHLVLIRELLPLLEQHQGRVVWTGSRSAANSRRVFDTQDLQHLNGRCEAYGSSKYVVDLVNTALNDRWHAQATRKPVSSFVVCPGAFVSGATPPVFRLVSPLMRLIRPWFKSLHVDTDRAALVILLLLTCKPDDVDASHKQCVQDGALTPCDPAIGAPPCPLPLARQTLKRCEELLAQWFDAH